MKILKWLFRWLRRIFFGSRFRIVHVQSLTTKPYYMVQKKTLSMSTTSGKVWEWKPVVFRGSTSIETKEEAEECFNQIIELGGTERVKVIRKL